MLKIIEQINNNTEFNNIIYDITINEIVLQMNNYRQHANTTCYEHCLYVAYYTYLVCKKFNLDYISATRAAMLHDLFLYDWRYRIDGRKGLHAFTHPHTALKNASKIFELNDIEKDVIINHMWPVTPSLPKYKESLIVTFTDKYSAIKETISSFEDTKAYKKMFRYAYIILGICGFRYYL